MYKGLGFDLCEVARMEKKAGDGPFLRRFFTEGEAEYIRSRGAHAAESLAGIFAAKEAFAKAMGTGITFDLREVEVRHGEQGEPLYALSGKAADMAGNDRFLLSISHDGGMAGAVCLREAGEKTEE